MALKATDWTAIKWYAKENNYTMRDMFSGPMIAFRNSDNEKIEVNIFDIKSKYAGRKKESKKVAS